MARIKYETDMHKPRPRLTVRDLPVGTKVVLTTMGYDRLHVTSLEVTKVTKTTITFVSALGNNHVFTVGTGEFNRDEIRTRRDYSGYSDQVDLWRPEDPRLKAWVQYRRQQEEIDNLQTQAVVALTHAAKRHLSAEDVQAAIVAAQAWLDATAEEVSA